VDKALNTHIGWWRKEGHTLLPSDLNEVLERFEPNPIVIETGYSGMMNVPKETEEYLKTKGAKILIERTRRACMLFNELSESKRTLAGLHLTC
jgi:hypothetical protein